MNVFLYVLILIVCSFSIGRFANLLIESIFPIAKTLRLHRFAISFLTIALAASIPELSLVLVSSSMRDPSIGISAVLGASICDLTIVMAVAIFMSKGLKIKSNVKKNDIFYMTGICLILSLLLIEGSLSIYDSLILFFMYSVYIYKLLKNRNHQIGDDDGVLNKIVWKKVILVAVGLVGLALSARGIVYSAESLADIFNIPVFLLGIAIVALGASLPELFFEISAIRHHQNDMVMGDIIGSVVTNSAFLVGLIGIMNPGAPLAQGAINLSVLFLVLVLLLLFIVIERKEKLSIRVGVILVFLYFAFICTQIVVNYI